MLTLDKREVIPRKRQRERLIVLLLFNGLIQKNIY